MATGARGGDLLGIAGLSRLDVVRLLEAADAIGAPAGAEIDRTSLRGRAVACLFDASSARHRARFVGAARRLDAAVIEVVAGSEPLVATIARVVALRADVFVIGHAASGAPHLAARWLEERGARCAVVNAGDGEHEDPIEALLGARAIRRATGRRDDFSHLRVAIVGDALHAPLARSSAMLLSTLGAEVRLCAPATLLPPALASLRPKDAPGVVRAVHRLDEAIDAADVVLALPLDAALVGSFVPSSAEYARTYGLSARRLARAKPGALVLHPDAPHHGPEIDDEVAGVVLADDGVAVWSAALALAVQGSISGSSSDRS